MMSSARSSPTMRITVDGTARIAVPFENVFLHGSFATNPPEDEQVRGNGI